MLEKPLQQMSYLRRVRTNKIEGIDFQVCTERPADGDQKSDRNNKIVQCVGTFTVQHTYAAIV